MRAPAWFGLAAIALAIGPGAAGVARAGEDPEEVTERPWLGISYTAMGGQVGGALVTNVFDDTAAIAAGLRVGDEIIEVDGEAITNGDLTVPIGSHAIGDKVMVRVYRDTHVVTLHPVLSRRITEAELLHNQLVGKPAPVFDLVRPEDPEGTTIDDSVLIGKVGVVAFFHTSCAACPALVNKLSPWIDAHGDAVGVVGLGGPLMLSPEQMVTAAKAILKSAPVMLPIGIDAEAWLRYGIFGSDESTHTKAVIAIVDRSGIVTMAAAIPGDADDSALDDVFAAAERALNQRKPRR